MTQSTMSHILCIGLDVHQDSIAVAYVAYDHGAEVTYLGTIDTRPTDIDQLVRKPSSRNRCARSTRSPNASSAWSKNSKTKWRRGACIPSSTPYKSCAASRSPSLSPWWRNSAISPALITQASG